jgi:hypothetical protein
MRSMPSLMDEFSAALQFSSGCGDNWYALRDSLQYLDEWLPARAYVLVIDEAEELLGEKASELKWLMQTFHEVGEWWKLPISDNDRFNRPGVPFHVLCHCSTTRSCSRLLAAGAEAGVPIRVDEA